MMFANQVFRHRRKHLVELPFRHGEVCTQGRHHINQSVAVVVMSLTGQHAGSAVETREVRRQSQHAIAITQLLKGFVQAAPHVFVRQFGGR